MPQSRRQFIAAVGASAVAAQFAALAAAAELDPARKIRVGIVGGGFGSAFFFHLHPNCTVEAVSDLRPERLQHLQETYKCSKGYPSLAELLKDPKIEAVGIYTEAPNHVRHVIEALKAGKHCLCAVPAAMTLEECSQLIETVKKTGLTYMMAETSYYRQEVITARRMFAAGEFGDLFECEAEYHHDGLQSLFWENGKPGGKRTWRYGFPPMHYPTHSTSMLTGVSGERLAEVVCLGWGDDDPILKDNDYKNPFWSATAFFKTDRHHAFRVAVYWKVAAGGCERAKWFGDKKSFHMAHPNGFGPIIAEPGDKIRPFDQPLFWKTELPEPLRVDSGHGGSHTFLTHEFIESLVQSRRPAIDVYEAVAYTAPGIVAHQSALKGGELMKVPDFGKGRG
ncbi:Gfo/Idh/MocA family oxidoreductase [Candidatus Sumerlaeota bacterium]|nr:Gfo/Idh/MocA family oxidoreductase [Candidatus Sumerlaeota bacterium]